MNCEFAAFAPPFEIANKFIISLAFSTAAGNWDWYVNNDLTSLFIFNSLLNLLNSVHIFLD